MLDYNHCFNMAGQSCFFPNSFTGYSYLNSQVCDFPITPSEKLYFSISSIPYILIYGGPLQVYLFIIGIIATTFACLSVQYCFFLCLPVKKHNTNNLTNQGILWTWKYIGKLTLTENTANISNSCIESY